MLSEKQIKSLHLWFGLIAKTMNETGAKYQLNNGIEIPMTKDVFKESFWKPVQKKLFNKSSTTKLTSQEMNCCIDLWVIGFAELGIVLDEFPTLENKKL